MTALIGPQHRPQPENLREPVLLAASSVETADYHIESQCPTHSDDICGIGRGGSSECRGNHDQIQITIRARGGARTRAIAIARAR